MRQPSAVAIVCLLALASGCGQEPARITLSEPRSAPAPTEASQADAEAYAGPRDARAVLASGEPPPEQLAAWALDEQAPAAVRLTSLRRLETQEGGDALDAALDLLANTGADPQLRANAVAVLARSEDPRADARIARLEPRYQQLARALRAQRRKAN